MLLLDLSSDPSCTTNKISSYTFPYSSEDYSWIYTEGEVLLIVYCVDGKKIILLSSKE